VRSCRHRFRLAERGQQLRFGLILLFERPIHVGDTVQVGSLKVGLRRIGIRASVVRTMQGAGIIVPNAQLITEQVTNWTLSDQLRRLDLPWSELRC